MKVLRTYQSLFTGLCGLLALLAARMAWHGSIHFGFLVWNIFLAILPLFFAHCTAHSASPLRRWLYAALWLVFFPNAAYLLTDIVHLRLHQGAAFWLDLVLLFSAGLYGVVLGMRSLRLMEDWYGRFLRQPFTGALTALLLLANGYGIYLGRVERWNSWDVVCNTGSLLQSVAHQIRHPLRCMDVWALSGVFAAALGLGYFAVYRRLA